MKQRCREQTFAGAQCILLLGHSGKHCTGAGATWEAGYTKHDTLALFHQWDVDCGGDLHQYENQKKARKRKKKPAKPGTKMDITKLMPGDVIDIDGRLYVLFLPLAGGIGARKLDDDFNERRADFQIINKREAYFVGTLKAIRDA